MISTGNGNKGVVQRATELEPTFDPFFDFMRSRKFGQLFDYMLRPTLGFPAQTFVAPEINLYEKEGEYILECALPGLTKEQIKIEAVDNKLTISAEAKQNVEEKEAKFHYRELRAGSYYRSVSFAEKIDPKLIFASYENGILKVRIPVPKTAMPYKVAIQS